MTDMCKWPVDMKCLPEVTEDNANQLREAIDTATLVLWTLTGRRFGACPTEYVLPPPRRGCGFEPRRVNGEWFNVVPGGSRTIALPGPVYRVTGIEGPAGESFPVGESVGDLLYDVPADARVVKYLRGEPIPAGAATMVGTLAKERYLQCIGDTRCRLPRNATSVSRQGVSVQMPSPQEIIESGATGLPDVDLWVRSLNPNGLHDVSEVIL